MKKLLLLLLSAFVCVTVYSQLQQIKIVSFTVKNQLPAVIDNWNSVPGSLLLVAQKPPTIQLKDIRLVLQIKANGAIVCSNASSGGIPVDDFTTRTFSAGELTGAFAGCHDLKDGNYTICAQFTIDRRAISNEICKEFKVETPKETDFAPPTLITPDNGKKFAENELSTPVTFRWTPLVPKPREPVTYRIKVWQLMQGQNGLQAMRSNQPIATKDVDNITQAVISGIYTGPCKPPYLCDFIWQVQALNRDGKPMGRNEGNSEPYTFSVTQNESGEFKNVSPDNNKKFSITDAEKPITFRWTTLVPKPREPVTYRIKVWQLMAGQNGTQAMRENKPIATKDVENITETTVSSIYTGPCKPPYLCDFIWNVQAVTREGKPIGRNEGNSEPYTFSVTLNESGEFKNVSPDNNKKFSIPDAEKPITFRWTTLVPKPREPVTYRLKVWQLMDGQNGTQAMRENKPIATKDVENITEATVSSLYTGPCKPPYLCDFIWNVQAVTREGKPIGKNDGNSEPYSFSVTQNEGGEFKNEYPENNKRFSKTDAKKPVTFRWTTLVPKPKEPVTYRIKVWQLMEGQNGTQAMKENKPIATKDVENITEATFSSLYTGPCKPPYLCDFIWNVQAVTREGKPIGRNNGNTEPFSFKILDDNINTKIDSVSISCCINGKQNIYIKINNLHPTNQAQVTAIKYRVNGTGPLTTLSPTVPPIAFTIPANSSQAFTASINCVDSMKTIKFIVDAIWPTDPDNINNETAWDTLHCACDACDEKHFTLNVPSPKNISINNNTISFVQPITVTTTPPKTIKSIMAELVYFEMVPENDMCIPCDKDAATYGHFTNGTNSDQWNGPQQTLNINITTPQLTPCCSAVFKWCIRYKIEFTDCTSCNKLVCYEKKKEGCEKGNPNPNNDKK